MRFLACFVSSMLLAFPIAAQSPAQLKTELRTKESAAKQDPDALFAVGKWADEKGLAAEAKRIYQAVLKIKPDHEGANKAVGNELAGGKWMPAKDAAAAKKSAADAENTAKGLVEVNGVWVDKDHAADAKKGIYHHNGELVTKDEKLAFLAGRVRHPSTGMMIDAADLEKAQKGQFPIAGGKWVDIKEADDFHRDHPWFVRTDHCFLLSTLPWKNLTEAKQYIDEGYRTVKPLLGNNDPPPALRPIVLVAATRDEFAKFGAAVGDAASSYGAFLGVPERLFKVEGRGEVRLAVALWDKDWGPYYARHAGALAFAGVLCSDAGAELPAWMLQGLGALASRFANRGNSSHFAGQHISKGGVKDLKSWFNSFDISGDMEPTAIDFNIFQAGLLLSYAKDGKDPKVLEAMMEVTNNLVAGKGKSVEKSADKLQKLLLTKENEIRAYLQAVAAGK